MPEQQPPALHVNSSSCHTGLDCRAGEAPLCLLGHVCWGRRRSGGEGAVCSLTHFIEWSGVRGSDLALLLLKNIAPVPACSEDDQGLCLSKEAPPLAPLCRVAPSPTLCHPVKHLGFAMIRPTATLSPVLLTP